jgi:hypothetical protein
MPMENNTKYGIFVLGALSLIMLSSLVLADSSQDSSKLANDIDKPTSICIYASLIPYTPQDLDNNSMLVIKGTVKDILPPRWNTVDGKQPNKSVDDLNPSDLIYTDVIVSVDKCLKNSSPSNEITVRVIGGTIENISMTTDYEPSFKTGEKVLLYLSKDQYTATNNVGFKHLVVTGYLQGKFTLTDDGKAVSPYETFSQDKLLSTIKN